MSTVEIELMDRSLVRRYGRRNITVSMADAARLIKANKAKAVTSGFEGPPVSKIIARPPAAKGAAAADPLPVKEEVKKKKKKKKKTSSPDPSGKDKVSIDIEK
jgi:hypothetical protein